ncbi:hypothetical protein [Nannocystis radixulma]|uniref:Outer membrane protein beta-barrel domain-containing protein n=1 Tax=Nannocystis radixulma TaxID=2995305 RepID=A0ABT5BSS2_9BACT|nr:hypothetical protein [Nannocystis radixulma]MDC0676027.1 hypothetical protein [Nannocystis radixulma]
MSGASVLLLLGALAQVPEPSADDVTWSAPARCPGRDVLLAKVAARRGRALEPGQARVVGRATVVGPRRYRLDLDLDVRGRRDSRTLVARSCEALVDAAVLVITLALDADREPGSPSPEPIPDATVPEPTAPARPAPQPEAPLDPVPEPAAPPAVEPAPPDTLTRPPAAAPAGELAPPMPAPRNRPGGFLRLHGLGEIGALPGPTGGVGLAGGLLWKRFRLELHATYLAPRTDDRSGTEVRASLVAGAALGCVRLGNRRVFELPLCLGLEAGGIPLAADGPVGHKTAVGRWFAGSLGVGAAMRVHPRVALFAMLQGFAAFQRGTFVVRRGGADVVLFDPGVGSARLALGVEVRFGESR